jgi:predicted AAA+ superfamily ATPase
MERILAKELLAWKNNKNKKPLILHGARQVGKTYLIVEFGKKNYSNISYFNFEGNKNLSDIFENDLNPTRIIRELEALSSCDIIPNKTLIIFDEIQACEKAITSLKYFYENAKEYNFIAAGSLLGIALNRNNLSFPVGKIDILTLHPMNFKEFLLATNNKKLINEIENSYNNDTPLSAPLHEKSLELYRTYLIVGGMPACINEYLTKKDFDFVKIIQNNIYDTYISDMTKYSTPNESIKTIAAYNSVPQQLAKENKKFMYNIIQSGARAKTYEFSLEWLKKAGVVINCSKVNEGKLPLEFYKDILSYKIYMSDVGILTGKSNFPSSLVLSSASIGGKAKWALTENYIAQELIANGHIPYYWESNGKAELDFVLQIGDKVIPIESKSSENVKAKSFSLFMKKYSLTYGIRISGKNFGFENNIKSVPLYAVFCI